MPDPNPLKPGPDDDELLDAGQEEVFSRTEVERGVTEHAVEAGRHGAPPSERKD
jgi:hypothetical protein